MHSETWQISRRPQVRSTSIPVSKASVAQQPEYATHGAAPGAVDKSGNNFLDPLQALPHEHPSEAYLLRRALTSPWRQLLTSHGTQQASSRGGANRSCHAFGSAATAASPVQYDASVPGRVDRRSAASAASQRSLFTIDGLPEDAAAAPHDAAVLAIPPDYFRALPAGDASSSGSGRQPSRQRPPYNAAAASARRFREQPSCLQPLRLTPDPAQQPPQPQQQLIHMHQYYRNRAGELRANAGSDPSLRQVAILKEGCSVHSTYASSSTVNAAGAGTGAAAVECDAVASAQRPPLQQRRSLHPDPQVQPSSEHVVRHGLQGLPPPQPQVPDGSSRHSGTGLLGAMHHLLQRPDSAEGSPRPPPAVCSGDGGNRVDGRSSSGDAAVGCSSTEPLLAAAAALVGVADAGGAPHGAPHPAAAAAPWTLPPADRLSYTDWDDVRNPMSFNYNPSLEQPLPERHLRYVQESQCHQALLQGSGRPSGGAINESPHRYAAGIAENGAAAAQYDGVGRAAGRREDLYGADGAEGAEVVTASGPFVVLEMKGPRGTPSTRAAAAAAVLAGASASPAAPDAAAAAAGMQLTLRGRMASYFSKWRGVGDTLMPADHPIDIFWSWLGAFLSILVVAVLNQYLTPQVSLPLMTASFGASAVLLFGVPASKLAQPRNFLGGQVVSAVVGVLVRLAFIEAPSLVWLSAALGMSLALAAMQLTRTVHPPGGASALIASSVLNIGPWYGFKFVLTVFFGCLAMLVVAILINNLSSRRRYPTYWMGK